MQRMDGDNPLANVLAEARTRVVATSTNSSGERSNGASKLLRRLGVDAPDSTPAPECARCGDSHWLRTDLAPGHPDFGKPIPCPDCRGEAWQRAERRRRYEALMQRARIPEIARREDWSFAGFPDDPAKRDVVEAARLWAEGDATLRRYWQLYLHGPFGTGKTGLAVAILRAGLERGEAGLFWTVPDLLTAIKATFGKAAEGGEAALLEAVAAADLLVLDDVGESEPSEWARGKLYQLINRRAYDRQRTVYTSNAPWSALERVWDARIVERVKYGCLPLPLGGANLREREG